MKYKLYKGGYLGMYATRREKPMERHMEKDIETEIMFWIYRILVLQGQMDPTNPTPKR